MNLLPASTRYLPNHSGSIFTFCDTKRKHERFLKLLAQGLYHVRMHVGTAAEIPWNGKLKDHVLQKSMDSSLRAKKKYCVDS